MRSWIISAIAALSFTTSAASAEQVDQNTRQQIERIVTAYQENWNNHNAAGIAGLYTKDGVLVTQAPKVVKTGEQEIEQQYESTRVPLPRPQHLLLASRFRCNSFGESASTQVGISPLHTMMAIEIRSWD